MKILVVEDDADIAENLRNDLSSSGHTVELASDGADGSFLARSYDFDLIILDYSLPKKNGLQVCGEIRSAHRDTPILFLSINDDTDIKVAALEAGADDYITKPFSLKELNARIKAVKRRPRELKGSQLSVGDLALDPDRHQVTRAGKHVHLTRKEFNLLEYLMRNQGILLSRAMIMEHVWTADSDPFSNTVESHLRNVRMKINVGRSHDLIANIPGRGYVIDTAENIKRLIKR
jgi:two-component system OmpR family response regulator